MTYSSHKFEQDLLSLPGHELLVKYYKKKEEIKNLEKQIEMVHNQRKNWESNLTLSGLLEPYLISSFCENYLRVYKSHGLWITDDQNNLLYIDSTRGKRLSGELYKLDLGHVVSTTEEFRVGDMLYDEILHVPWTLSDIAYIDPNSLKDVLHMLLEEDMLVQDMYDKQEESILALQSFLLEKKEVLENSLGEEPFDDLAIGAYVIKKYAKIKAQHFSSSGFKVGVISDCHGNYDALGAVLNYLGDERIDALYFLGDLVDRGPDPLGCMKLLESFCNERMVAFYNVLGNHDDDYIGLGVMRRFYPETPYSKKLEHFLTCASVLYVDQGMAALFHGALCCQKREILWGSVGEESFDQAERLAHLCVHFGFYGHTHQQEFFSFKRENGRFVHIPENKFIDGNQFSYTPSLDGNCYFFCNPGSAGGGVRGKISDVDVAQFALFEKFDESFYVTFKEIPYCSH